MKATIKSIQEKGCVITAKNWWATLTPSQKLLALSILAGMGTASVFYFAFGMTVTVAATGAVCTGYLTHTLVAFDTISKQELLTQ